MLNVVMLNDVMLNVVMLKFVMLNVVMLNDVMLNVVMLNVVILNVVMLSVLAPLKNRWIEWFCNKLDCFCLSIHDHQRKTFFCTNQLHCIVS
jgi:hypothetical protein